MYLIFQYSISSNRIVCLFYLTLCCFLRVDFGKIAQKVSLITKTIDATKICMAFPKHIYSMCQTLYEKKWHKISRNNQLLNQCSKQFENLIDPNTIGNQNLIQTRCIMTKNTVWLAFLTSERHQCEKRVSNPVIGHSYFMHIFII